MPPPPLQPYHSQTCSRGNRAKATADMLTRRAVESPAQCLVVPACMHGRAREEPRRGNRHPLGHRSHRGAVGSAAMVVVTTLCIAVVQLTGLAGRAPCGHRCDGAFVDVEGSRNAPPEATQQPTESLR